MKTNKYFALSDIHGRDISIQAFEDKGFDIKNRNHYIVLVGDYFDRNPLNLKVLRFIEKYRKRLNSRFITLIGNHDEFVFKFIDHIEKNVMVGESLTHDEENLDRWLRNGGDQTIRQLFGPYKGRYTQTKAKNLARLKSFYAELKGFYETQDYIFTHAAINEERIYDAWDREFLHIGLDTHKTVIIGHSSHTYLDKELFDFYEYGGGIVAQSKAKTKCPILDIDNGHGNNIVVFEEKII